MRGSAATPSGTLAFGPFEIDPDRRLLLRGGGEVPLGQRQMDLLIAFTRRPGRLLTHGELIETTWPRSPIDESTLRVYVSALRRALGDGHDGARYIVNEHGRGYRFVETVVAGGAEPAPRPASSFGLPPRTVSLIGRGALLEEIAGAVAAHRLVTLVGPGGIGKTQAALAAAWTLQEAGADVLFLDLGLLADEDSLCELGALALGLDRSGAAWAAAASPAGPAKCLVLDNCEHMVTALSRSLDKILESMPGLRILATSREAIRCASEHVVRLAGLDCPTEADASSLPAAAAAPAVQLFLERTAATAPDFRIGEDTIADVSRLCRRLDGIPLTLELAAGWIRLIPVAEIASGLDTRLLALTRGQPTSLARHRTLEAVLDWSYDLLSPGEQDALRRLSVFQSGFTADAAAQVLECADPASARDMVSPLVEKSLVATDGATFRLPEATRAYAWRLQAQHPRADLVQALHARYCIGRLRTADADLLTFDRDTWTRAYGALAGDVKAALAWCFSDGGDAALGTELATSSVQVALQSGLGGAFRRYFRTALARVGAEAPGRAVAGLRFAYALLLADETGTTTPYRTEAATPDGPQASPEVHASLFAGSYIDGDYPEAGRCAEQVMQQGEERGDRSLVLAGSRMLAQTQHHLGRHREAERLARRVLAGPLQFLPLSNVSQQVSMRIILSRIAFLSGDPVTADALAAEALAEARENNGPAVCQALTQARIPLAVWKGDPDAADADLRLLRATAHDLKLQYWIGWLEGLEMAFDVLRAPPDGRGRLRFALSLRRLPAKLTDQIATFDPSLLTPEASQRVEAGTVGWCAPEVLRAEARQTPDPERRRQLLRDAVARATEQGAVAWLDRIDAEAETSPVAPDRNS